MIVLIGGTGFLGSHFRAQFPGERFAVVNASKRTSARTAFGQESFLDWSDFAGPLGDALLARASAVVYMIGASVPGTYEAHPWREASNNVPPALELFSRCAELCPAARIVLTSSGGTIYGFPQTRLISEDHPARPISSYGLGKLMVEEALTYVTRTRGIRSTVLRISNPIGCHHSNPRQGLVPAAMRAILSNEPIILYGGSAVRDYVDADDVGRALRLACRDERPDSWVLNVGSGVGHSNIEIISLVEEMSGRSVPVMMAPPRAIDVPYVVLDCQQAKEHLGWTPHRPLRESILDVWETLVVKSNA